MTVCVQEASLLAKFVAMNGSLLCFARLDASGHSPRRAFTTNHSDPFPGLFYSEVIMIHHDLSYCRWRVMACDLRFHKL